MLSRKLNVTLEVGSHFNFAVTLHSLLNRPSTSNFLFSLK